MWSPSPRNLGEDLDNDTSSQDTSDQQEARDKQKPIDVEKTKQIEMY
jgi:hypothetical protein